MKVLTQKSLFSQCILCCYSKLGKVPFWQHL